MRRIKTVGLLLSLFLVGCASHTVYRDREPIVPKWDDTRQPYRMAYIEFDESGEFWNDDQYFQTLELIHRINERPEGAVFVTFIHGWKHNASIDDGNARDFERVIGEISADEAADATAKRRPVREIVGIYLGWRGNSIIIRDPIKSVSYYNRHNAAMRTAGTPITETIYSILKSTRTNDYSRTVVAGHSMGALVLERAITPAFVGLILDNAISKQRAARRGTTAATEETFVSPADLVLLINEAGPSIWAKSFIETLDRWEYQPPPIDGKYVCNAGGPQWRYPMVVAVTSTGDKATGQIFPAAHWASSAFRRFRSYDDPQSPTQRWFTTRTAGHTQYLWSHRVDYKRVTGDGGMEAKPCDCGSAPANALCFTLAGHQFRLDESRMPDGSRFNDSAYWVVSVKPDVIKNHNDIWNDQFRTLVRGIIQVTRAADPTRPENPAVESKPWTRQQKSN